MFPIPSLGWLLLGAVMRRFAHRHHPPDSTMYYVVDNAEELGYRIVELPTIPRTVTDADEFLHWIGRRG